MILAERWHKLDVKLNDKLSVLIAKLEAFRLESNPDREDYTWLLKQLDDDSYEIAAHINRILKG